MRKKKERKNGSIGVGESRSERKKKVRSKMKAGEPSDDLRVPVLPSP